MPLRTRTGPDTGTPTYEEFVAARWTALYRTAYLLTANHADAEDLAQTALVKAYLSWSRVAAAASPDAYVRRILTNEFLSSRRPLRVSRERLVDRAPEVAAVASEGARPRKCRTRTQMRPSTASRWDRWSCTATGTATGVRG